MLKYLIYFILIAIVLFFVKKFMNKFMSLPIGNMVLISGGVKTGKSTLAVASTRRQYRSVHRHWKIQTFFRKLFKKQPFEEPLIYSNIPLSVPYVDLTEDLIFRRKRFRYGSVVYVNEASLMADSQLIKDSTLNERLLLFNKLIGHEGVSSIIYDSQTVSDCHYSIKRCLSDYYYIERLIKWIPFILIAKVQHCRYSDDNSTLNVITGNSDEVLRTVILPKSTWKVFDAFCYSSLTDDLEVEDNVVVSTDLKCRNIVSFRNFKTLPKKYIKGDYVNEKTKN